MNRLAKIIFYFIPITFFLTAGCNNKDASSPYDEILSRPPYSGITDSIRSAPLNAELYFRRAVLLNKNNFPEPALADFEKAFSIDKKEQYALGAGNLLMKNKPDAAITFIQQAIKLLPQSVMLRLSLARTLAMQNKTDEALKVCDEILLTDPFQLKTLVLKSELLDKKQNTSESIATLEKAIAIAPELEELNYNLAFKYAQDKNPKVLTLCDSLIKKDSLNIHPEPFYFKGVYYYNTNDKTKAIELFDLAIQHDYNFLDAYIDKGRTLYEMKKYEEAFIILQRAASITPTFADAYYWMAKCQEAVGEKDEARLNYQRAYGLDKTLIEAKEAADKLK